MIFGLDKIIHFSNYCLRTAIFEKYGFCNETTLNMYYHNNSKSNVIVLKQQVLSLGGVQDWTKQLYIIYIYILVFYCQSKIKL